MLDSSSDKQPSDCKPVQSDDSEGIHNTLVYITHTRSLYTACGPPQLIVKAMVQNFPWRSSLNSYCVDFGTKVVVRTVHCTKR